MDKKIPQSGTRDNKKNIQLFYCHQFISQARLEEQKYKKL